MTPVLPPTSAMQPVSVPRRWWRLLLQKQQRLLLHPQARLVVFSTSTTAPRQVTQLAARHHPLMRASLPSVGWLCWTLVMPRVQA